MTWLCMVKVFCKMTFGNIRLRQYIFLFVFCFAQTVSAYEHRGRDIWAGLRLGGASQVSGFEQAGSSSSLDIGLYGQLGIVKALSVGVGGDVFLGPGLNSQRVDATVNGHIHFGYAPLIPRLGIGPTLSWYQLKDSSFDDRRLGLIVRPGIDYFISKRLAFGLDVDIEQTWSVKGEGSASSTRLSYLLRGTIRFGQGL